MSKKEKEKKIITDIIKNVLENRNDIELSETFVRRVALCTLKSTPVIDLISEMQAGKSRTVYGGNDSQLTPCIEVLAIITHMIEYQASKGLN